MAVAEEPPKDIVENELRRPEVQRMLKENFGREGQTWSSPEFRAGYMFAFELSDAERQAVLERKQRDGLTLLDALKALGFAS